VVSALKGHLSKDEVDEILAEMQLPADARTEQLGVSSLLRLTELVRAKVPDWSR
jgi:hypothetical protein